MLLLEVEGAGVIEELAKGHWAHWEDWGSDEEEEADESDAELTDNDDLDDPDEASIDTNAFMRLLKGAREAAQRDAARQAGKKTAEETKFPWQRS